MASVEDRVLKIVRDQMCWADEAEQSKVCPGAAFLDDLGADSLDIVELIMTAEEQFDIDIADAEAETIITVSDAIKMIERKTAPHSSVPR